MKAYLRTLLIAAVGACSCIPVAKAELQNVTVGGSISIYGAWYSEFYEQDPNGAERIPAPFLAGRPIGPFGTVSFIRGDGHGNEIHYIEQRTRLNVKADFTQDVSAFIEFDANDAWGEDLRSDYVTGADSRANSSDDIDLYQAYINAANMYGLPVSLRVGRQELSFGNGFLVGANPFPDPFTGLSFDAIRLTYATEQFSIDAWMSKVAESGTIEQDGDVDFYGLYASYKGVENMEFDAFWMLVRDARRIQDTNRYWLGEWFENALELDDYDVTNLNAIGLRFAGTWNAFDWEAQGAYEFGNADAVGGLFQLGSYGDNSSEWDAWGGIAQVGYTVEAAAWKPRLFMFAAAFSGEDERSVSLRDWLNPFRRSTASVSFNRLFSDYELDAWLDGSGLSNFWMVQLGAEAKPIDVLCVSASVQYMQAFEPFAAPLYVTLGRYHVPVYPAWPFLTHEGEKDFGWQTNLSACYSYSDDLSIEMGWSHYFVGEAVHDGVFVNDNGLGYVGGTGTNSADYLYFQTTLEF